MFFTLGLCLGIIFIVVVLDNWRPPNHPLMV